MRCAYGIELSRNDLSLLVQLLAQQIALFAQRELNGRH
jgi:hypothetical protein